MIKMMLAFLVLPLCSIAQTVKDPVVVLGFDDAEISHYTIVAPMLQQYHFGATFFVCDFPRKTPADSVYYMNWSQISQLHQMGFEIGNHTGHHKNMTRLTREQQQQEVAYVEDKCKAYGIPKPVSFAYPGNRHDSASQAILHDMGYRFARTGGSALYVPGQHPVLAIPSYTMGSTEKLKSRTWKALEELKPGEILAFTIHGVPDIAHPDYTTDSAVFASCLQYMHDHHFKVIAMRDLDKYVAGAAPVVQQPLASSAVASVTIPAAKNKCWLFMLAGQSNMAGRGAVEPVDTIPHKRVWMLNKEGNWVIAKDPVHFDKSYAGVGPGLSFAKTLADADTSIYIGLVPCAVGGSGISSWLPASDSAEGGKNFQQAIERGKLAMQAGTFKAVLWHQGETDCSAKASTVYAQKLVQVITGFRKQLANDHLPFIAGQLPAFQKQQPDKNKVMQFNPYVDSINMAIAALKSKVPYYDYIQADSTTHKGDYLHFNAASARLMGKRYAVAVMANMGNKIQAGRKKAPVMGWSSWNHFRIHIDEKLIREQAEAMVTSGLYAAGYRFINIDDGYFGGRDSLGRLLADNKKFPSGMKALADYIHNKKLKAGIYTDAGKNTCGSVYDKDPNGFGVGIYGHIEEDCSLFLNEWGYDFLKVDWCGAEKMHLSEEETYTPIINAVKAVDSGKVINVCRWKFPGEWVTRKADSWRISSDIRPTFSSILKIIDLNAELYKYSSAGHYNDMDMLQVGRGMTYEEDKTHFSMWCMMNSPLLAGNDLRNMSNETLEILTNQELIALNQDAGYKQAVRVYSKDSIEVWLKPLGVDGATTAIAIVNRNKKETRFTLNSKMVAVNAKDQLRDLWRHENLGKLDKDKHFILPPHGVIVLKAATLQPNAG